MYLSYCSKVLIVTYHCFVLLIYNVIHASVSFNKCLYGPCRTVEVGVARTYFPEVGGLCFNAHLPPCRPMKNGPVRVTTQQIEQIKAILAISSRVQICIRNRLLGCFRNIAYVCVCAGVCCAVLCILNASRLRWEIDPSPAGFNLCQSSIHIRHCQVSAELPVVGELLTISSQLCL